MSQSTFKIKVTFAGGAKLAEKYGLTKGGRAQQTLDSAVIRRCLDYVPWATGTLAKSAYSATTIGSGKIIYPGPYAHYQYYGQVYGPNIPVFEDDSGIPTRFFSRPGVKKHPTGKPLTYNTSLNPLAGPFWLERMKADHTQDIVTEVKNAILNSPGK